MVAYPQGTIVVAKVNAFDSFAEHALNSSDISELGAGAFVLVSGLDQTITGEKTFVNLLYVPSGISAEGTPLNFYVNTHLAMNLGLDNGFNFKSHESGPGEAYKVNTSGTVTTDNNSTLLLEIPFENNTSCWFDIYTAGIRTSGSPERTRMEHHRGCVYTDPVGTSALVGTVDEVVKSSNAGVYEIVTSVSGNRLRVDVTGNTAETANWTCTAKYQVVSI